MFWVLKLPPEQLQECRNHIWACDRAASLPTNSKTARCFQFILGTELKVWAREHPCFTTTTYHWPWPFCMCCWGGSMSRYVATLLSSTVARWLTSTDPAWGAELEWEVWAGLAPPGLSSDSWGWSLGSQGRAVKVLLLSHQHSPLWALLLRCDACDSFPVTFCLQWPCWSHTMCFVMVRHVPLPDT